ncbi:MAG: UDP-N-acetylglucosamine--LPS N-acetylglucosamine transferase [Phycisphaerales bacterium]|nr:UDP-N-acetylglucosamine--LPS N-acetylglucosamine transferase [Phycisphaerales bacterium]
MRAAEAVELALREVAPGAIVRNLDVLTCATAAFRKVYASMYLDLVNRAPHLLGWFYDVTDKAPSTTRRTDRLRVLVQRANLKKLDPILKGEKGNGGPWDLFINTHFLPPEIIGRMRRKGQLPVSSRHLTVVTDFDAHGLWVQDPTAGYFVATEEAAITLGRWGMPREIVQITGIPIHPRFAKAVSSEEARTKHGLSQDRLVVLPLAGGFGVGPIEELYRAILTLGRPVHVCVVCGRNAKLKATLGKIKAGAFHKVTVLGFTTDMDELMAASDVVVTKPGGLTTSEILARGTALAIANPIPGQESRNRDYLLEHGAGIKIGNPAVAAHKLGDVLG